MDFRKENGFTLIEVLVSLTILTTIVIGMLTFFHQAYDYSNRNQNKTIGINVGRGVVEFMENQGFLEFKEKFNDTNCTVDGKVQVYVGINEIDNGNKTYAYSCNESDLAERIIVNNIPFRATALITPTTQNEPLLSFIVTTEWKHTEDNATQSISLEGVIVDESIR